jgi:hypothetical protein
VKTLPHQDIKVIIGDNLAAHLSPYVLRMCEKFNIRYIFLPQNSTHLMQPLDVAVFAPMKRRWREIVSEWKDDYMRRGENYTGIPKMKFPGLLKELMEKDYSESIRSGFKTTGLFPLSVEKALSKLPAEDREVESEITQKFIDKLSSMRYDQPPTKRASRPKKKDKLPAGASYTCLPGKKGKVGLAVESDSEETEEEEIDEDMGEEVEETGFEDLFSDENSDSEKDTRTQTATIIKRLERKKNWFEQQLISSSEDEDSQDKDSQDKDKAEQGSNDQQEKAEQGSNNQQEEAEQSSNDQQEKANAREKEKSVDDQEYLPGCFVVAVYQDAWYLAVVLDKLGEKNALAQNEYLYLNFMQRLPGAGNLFRWPVKPDKLNTLKEDILFKCEDPIPSSSTSSNRSITYTLSKLELKKADRLLNKAYYHTRFLLYQYLNLVLVLNLTKITVPGTENECVLQKYVCV